MMRKVKFALLPILLFFYLAQGSVIGNRSASELAESNGELSDEQLFALPSVDYVEPEGTIVPSYGPPIGVGLNERILDYVIAGIVISFTALAEIGSIMFYLLEKRG